MKYGLLITSPINSYKNIGDYIQSLAAKQFIQDDYCFVEKEEISKFDSKESIKVIMNAWFMWHPENWPPKPCIKPLLISMHISPLTANEMLEHGGKEYLIEHGPVGCRDKDTEKILSDAGVSCYFSGCLTLTLGESFFYSGIREGYYFVDPYIPPIRYEVDGKSVFYIRNILRGLWYALLYYKKAHRLVRDNVFFNARYKLQSYYNAAMFYVSYSTMFADEIIFGAEFLTHMISVSESDSNEKLLIYAEKLINKYAKAKLVVTSRIHCGLPCLGLETPMLFVLNNEMESKKNLFNAPGRFGGILDFFNVLYYENDTLRSRNGDFTCKGKVRKDDIVKNKDSWKGYCNVLLKKTKEFVKE